MMRYVKCSVIGAVSGLIVGLLLFWFVTFDISIIFQKSYDGMFTRLLLLVFGFGGGMLGIVTCKLLEDVKKEPKALGLLDHYYNSKSNRNKLDI